jgi:hypothetical protein
VIDSSEGTGQDGAVPEAAVEYARRLHSDVLAWYRSAETKAQVILTLDGILVGVFAGLTLSKPEDVSTALDVFQPETWILLSAGGASLTIAIGSAVACLVSRTYTRGGLRRFYDDISLDHADLGTYKPEALWFFQHIQGLDKAHFMNAIAVFTPQDEIQALASQIYVVSDNVRKKHIWVNSAFFFTGLSLVLLLALAVDYVVLLA